MNRRSNRGAFRRDGVASVVRSAVALLGFFLVSGCFFPSGNSSATAANGESARQDRSASARSLALADEEASLAERGWSMVWSDEFTGDRLDRSKWSPEVSCWGGGNEELQCYTDRESNIQVGNGVLRLVARPETWTGPDLPQERRANSDELRTQDFTSGKIRTRGLADWRYGRFSARMRLPDGQGAWPAFWMMPSEDYYGGWPLSGEIDILEAVNLGAACSDCGLQGQENRVQGALHFGSQWPDNVFLVQKTNLPDRSRPHDDYHVYSVEWGEGQIDWYVDGVRYFTLTADDWHSASPLAAGNEVAPFDRSMYLILNLAVGGRLSVQNNAGGVDPQAFPAELLVDWVRVYRCDGDPERGRRCMSNE
jgi:beta-glucanase (GH16 family)